MKIPKPADSSFSRKSGWVIILSRSRSVSSAPAMKAPRIVSSPSRSATNANTIRSRNAPRIRIWAVVSWRRKSTWESAGSRSAPATASADRTGDDNEPAEEDRLRADSAAFATEQQREEDDRAKIGDRPRRDYELAERRADLARVLEDRHDDPEGRCREHDRDEDAVAGKVDGVQPESDREGDDEGDDESERGEAQRPTSQFVHVDLETREKEQEREADQRQHRQRLVDGDPPEDGWPDHDPCHDLDDHGRQPERGHESERERHEERQRDDDQQVPEVKVSHRCSAPSRRSILASGSRRRGLTDLQSGPHVRRYADRGHSGSLGRSTSRSRPL